MAVILFSLTLSSCASRREATKEDVKKAAMEDMKELVYSSVSDPTRAQQVLLVYEDGLKDLQIMRSRSAYFETLGGGSEKTNEAFKVARKQAKEVVAEYG